MWRHFVMAICTVRFWKSLKKNILILLYPGEFYKHWSDFKNTSILASEIENIKTYSQLHYWSCNGFTLVNLHCAASPDGKISVCADGALFVLGFRRFIACEVQRRNATNLNITVMMPPLYRCFIYSERADAVGYSLSSLQFFLVAHYLILHRGCF